MKKKSIILIFIFIFICMVILAFLITCGIYSAIDYQKAKEIEKQEILNKEIERQEKEKIEAWKREQERKALKKDLNRYHIPHRVFGGKMATKKRNVNRKAGRKNEKFKRADIIAFVICLVAALVIWIYATNSEINKGKEFESLKEELAVTQNT